MPLVRVEQSFTTSTIVSITEEELSILQSFSKDMAHERSRVKTRILDAANNNNPIAATIKTKANVKYDGGAAFWGDAELFDFF